jgi:hypothetical protein
VLRGYIEGAIFLGTPHRGDERQSYSEILARFGRTYRSPNASRSATSDGLALNSDYYGRLTSDWQFLLPDIPVHTIFLSGAAGSQIPSRESATLGVTGEVHTPLSVDCDGLDWPAEDSKQAHKTILRCLQTLVASCGKTQAQRGLLSWPSVAHALPPSHCPVCSSLCLGELPFGPDAPVAEYTVDLQQPTQNNLKLWSRTCVLAKFAYHISSIWLGRDDRDYPPIKHDSKEWWHKYTCTRSRGSQVFLSTEHGKNK